MIHCIGRLTLVIALPYNSNSFIQIKFENFIQIVEFGSIRFTYIYHQQQLWDWLPGWYRTIEIVASSIYRACFTLLHKLFTIFLVDINISFGSYLKMSNDIVHTIQ